MTRLNLGGSLFVSREAGPFLLQQDSTLTLEFPKQAEDGENSTGLTWTALPVKYQDRS